MNMIKIKKWGENANSRQPKRRYIYFIIDPDTPSIVGNLRNLGIVWKTYYSYLCEWWKVQTCPYCKKRVEYEVGTFKERKYVWQRERCMRHYLVEHLCETIYSSSSIVSNRPFTIEATEDIIKFNVTTANYDYNIVADREKVVLECIYKRNKKYIFTYKNHTNAYPCNSSYQYIIHTFSDFFDDLANVFDDLERYKYDANIVVNNKLVVEAKKVEETETDQE